MNRIFALSLTALLVSASIYPAQKRVKPNVLFIKVNDLRPALGCNRYTEWYPFQSDSIVAREQ